MERWTREKANEWYAAQPWRVGCNFVPSTAVNQLEMWQEDTFDPQTIEKELSLAVGLGMNSVRVYLHDLAYDADPEGFKKRMSQFLDICDSLTVRPLFVFLDDCWGPNPQAGPQPEPTPRTHNSQWVQSPAQELKGENNTEAWKRLEVYIKDVLTTFATDERIFCWDLYNEPGNSKQGDRSMPLLKKVFEWARSVETLTQPLTAGMWNENLVQFNELQAELSDIISFHNYNDTNQLRLQIQELQNLGRPIICTEWLRRPHSVPQTHLPIFQKENIACYNWGLVAGKINTIWPWDYMVDTEDYKDAEGEPVPWFHDLLRADGTPYSEEEIKAFREITTRT